MTPEEARALSAKAREIDPAKAYDIALLELKRRGYRVSTVEERPNETTTEVSWANI